MVVLTPKAVAKIKEVMAQQEPKPGFLRVGVCGGGCSGFQYKLEFDSREREGDEALDFDGLKVVVDQMSAMYLEDVTIDYLETLEASGFKFDNPNIRSTCGCGQSFSY